MSKAAISFFLWDTIKSSHASFPDSSCHELKVRAHSICGIATSMLMWKNCSVPTILRAACWRTHSFFADHYLREIVRQEGDIFALGPVVTAGHVVDELLDLAMHNPRKYALKRLLLLGAFSYHPGTLSHGVEGQ
ncbi:hypothetical protein E2C01_034807 [Portunus trituberculatus]|uniref:Uncharacterized protein n=1 Tax=Portunus trituberculatus TaxID=210409 RepID=A0A5B7F1I6_PORTR|nr:hypothetical protein [Portunus trituberculatus]